MSHKRKKLKVDKSNEKHIEDLNDVIRKCDKSLYKNTFYSRFVIASEYKLFDLKNAIENLGKKIFDTKIKVYEYGSYLIGLAEEGKSEIDLFVDIGDKYYSFRNSQESQEILNKLKDGFEGQRSMWEVHKMQSIPILSVCFIPLKLLCNIRVDNGFHVQNSKIISHLFDLQPEALAMCHFIKRWIQFFNIKNLKGFSLTLFMVFFLQYHNYLPSIQQVQENLPKMFIDGMEVQFDKNRSREYYAIKELKCYKHALKLFFDFYSYDFYANNVICTFFGELIDKKSYVGQLPKANTVTLPAPLIRWINAGKSINNLDVGNFINACKTSYEFLCNYHPQNYVEHYFKFNPYDCPSDDEEN